MKIVIDTNVWVSALVFGGNPRKILENAASQGLIIVYSAEQVTEITRVISTKFPDFLRDFEALLTALQPRMRLVKLGLNKINVSRDPKDNFILETAAAGSADYIITGDDDLLSVADFRDIKIVSPAGFLKPA